LLGQGFRCLLSIGINDEPLFVLPLWGYSDLTRQTDLFLLRLEETSPVGRTVCWNLFLLHENVKNVYWRRCQVFSGQITENIENRRHRFERIA
jgi:hypothetical protein